MSELPGDSKKAITFKYTYKFDDGVEKQFIAKLDEENLDLINAGKESYPEWTRLENCRCSNCTLDVKEYPYCPVAANLSELAESFKDMFSYEEVDVFVETSERSYLKHTDLQQGVGSLIGIYMVTSGCPVMDKLRPMVNFHLPFATLQETTYRAISMYLVAQLLLYRRGKKPDLELASLVEIYDEVRIVNEHIIKRLSGISTLDANLNAVIILDNFANYVKFVIDEDLLHRLEKIFTPYLS